MRIILFAALFLLPISAVAALPLHNVAPEAMHHRHHPLTGKKLHNTAAVHHPVTGRYLNPVRRHPLTGKKLHNTAKAGLDVHQMHKDTNIHKMPIQHFNDKSLVFDRKH
jgi:hypothetical protein